METKNTTRKQNSEIIPVKQQQCSQKLSQEIEAFAFPCVNLSLHPHHIPSSNSKTLTKKSQFFYLYIILYENIRKFLSMLTAVWNSTISAKTAYMTSKRQKMICPFTSTNLLILYLLLFKISHWIEKVKFHAHIICRGHIRLKRLQLLKNAVEKCKSHKLHRPPLRRSSDENPSCLHNQKKNILRYTQNEDSTPNIQYRKEFH